MTERNESGADSPLRGRLAPSPTGALHLGNIRTFLLAWLSVRARAGQVVMRVEDLDGPRVKPGAMESMLDDLHWLGFDWDEGPDVGGPFGPYVQTQRLARYDAALEQLIEAGRVYPCLCSRGDIERAASAPHPGEEGPRYPGLCDGRFGSLEDATAAATAAGRSLAWRFRVPPGPIPYRDELHGDLAFDVAQFAGDFVIRKGSGTAAYQLAVVVDDAAMRITEVVRGDDLLTSTPRQRLLYDALGLTPPTFRHVPLVVGPDGLRLAKRHGDTRVAYFRARGIAPERLIGWLATSCGLAPPGTALLPRALVESFAWSRVPRERVVCDEASLLSELA